MRNTELTMLAKVYCSKVFNRFFSELMLSTGFILSDLRYYNLDISVSGSLLRRMAVIRLMSKMQKIFLAVTVNYCELGNFFVEI